MFFVMINVVDVRGVLDRSRSLRYHYLHIGCNSLGTEIKLFHFVPLPTPLGQRCFPQIRIGTAV